MLELDVINEEINVSVDEITDNINLSISSKPEVINVTISGAFGGGVSKEYVDNATGVIQSEINMDQINLAAFFNNKITF